MQFFNKNGEVVEFDTIEDLVSFLTSDDNQNIDIKKGLASIAHLPNADEAALLVSSNLDVVKATIGKMYKTGGIDADGNIITDNDDGIINNIFDNEIRPNLSDDEYIKIKKYMDFEELTLKRTNNNKVLDPFIIVDTNGNVKGIETIAVRNPEGNKIPIMIPNIISIQEWLSEDSKRDPLNYQSEINNPISVLEWLAEDSNRISTDYPIDIPNPVSLETWLAEDSNRVIDDYPTEIHNSLTKDEWLAEDDTREEEDYPEMIPNPQTINSWLAGDSKRIKEDYIDIITNPETLVQWLAEETNRIIDDYPKLIDNPQSKIDWLAMETNRKAEDYPNMTQEVDDNNNLVWETELIDFTVTNRASLINIITLIADKSELEATAIQLEIEKSILDNADIPVEIATKYLSSDNLELKMKALVHPKTEKTALFNSVKTDVDVPQTFKMDLLSAIETKEQLISSLDIITFFMNMDLTIGNTAEQANSAMLKSESLKKVTTILLSEFSTSNNIDIDIEALIALIQ